MSTPVAMSHPATAQKNSDGTYTVRIQHTAEGSVTEVHFTNVFFAEALANSYAAVLNGTAKVGAVAEKIEAEVKAGLPEAEAEVERLIADAKAEGKKFMDAARLEAEKLVDKAKAEADNFRKDGQRLSKAAQQLVDEAKIEAAKLIEAAQEEISKLKSAKPKPQKPAVNPIADEGDEA